MYEESKFILCCSLLFLAAFFNKFCRTPFCRSVLNNTHFLCAKAHICTKFLFNNTFAPVRSWSEIAASNLYTNTGIMSCQHHQTWTGSAGEWCSLACSRRGWPAELTCRLAVKVLPVQTRCGKGPPVTERWSPMTTELKSDPTIPFVDCTLHVT